ncbi:MAG: flagellar biosynthesis protein FliR [Verrucomicrobiales bacterium]|nr:flagellar biosynthesis protein FliR [Verrucomicrobiales bacterium]MDB6131164.1 flagellar biosynthesis protein FliR [Verrucomicrobiales bacterium]
MNFDLDFLTWMMVFLRASAMLAIFPVFSSPGFPVQVRLALGALVSFLVTSSLPSMIPANLDWMLGIKIMITEVLVGLSFGFMSRLLFYAIDLAGGIISMEIGLSLPPSFNPLSNTQAAAPGSILNYMAAMIWLSMDMHHWMLLAFKKSYLYLPIGGAHMGNGVLTQIFVKSSGIFMIAAQMTAPIIAVSFTITVVFAVLSRAVPQMNVFSESYAVKTLAGMTVFGLTAQLMSQHIGNYLNRLPEDVLRVAQLLGN